VHSSLCKNFFSCYETQQLILGTGTAIWWLTEPHCKDIFMQASGQSTSAKIAKNRKFSFKVTSMTISRF
jgi:hypothetical protein